MKIGLTFDTGALIALERRTQRMWRAYAAARETGVIVTVPAVVIAEWWHGRTDVRDRILLGVRVEQIDTALMKTAGQAVAATRGATTIDAIVMASAARRGDVVYTSDYDDLDRLTGFFESVRVLRC
ncbi:MAG TPA: PIN domain-containing protein [Polyangiaceae bacterium]|nr:PIN domain-containing protein [Polyangiaceae bacterium]